VKQLYLLRHAKSSWDDPSLADHERPLAPRGRRAAKKVRAHMRAAGIEPALVLCSPSRRTRETLDLLGAAVGADVRFEPALYAANEDELLGVLRGVPARVPSALVIGHNPGLQRLGVALAGSGDEHLISRMAEKMPTAALASLSLPIREWSDLATQTGELVGYIEPREL
jgi:phosphohistidine phosphatase